MVTFAKRKKQCFMLTEINYAIAVLTIRLIAGILFFFQGYDKVFRVGMSQVALTMRTSLSHRNIPNSVISFIAIFTSWAEMICGFLLVLGFFKFFAIYVLCLNLVVIVFGLSLGKAMWENNHVFIRLALLILLLLLPGEWDRFSVDFLFTLTKLSA
jgi:uncharacterized membrane protein YphA (DoxX/SURF4 family)